MKRKWNSGEKCDYYLQKELDCGPPRLAGLQPNRQKNDQPKLHADSHRDEQLRTDGGFQAIGFIVFWRTPTALAKSPTARLSVLPMKATKAKPYEVYETLAFL